jgi:hypothetical protein
MSANSSHETQNSLQCTVKQLFNFKVNKRTSEFARWHVYLCLCVFLFRKVRDLVSLSVENQKLLKDFCSPLFAPDLEAGGAGSEGWS